MPTEGGWRAARLWREWRQRLRRRIRQWQGHEPRTRVQIRCDREELGGWWICPQAVRAGDVVYSFSVGGDLQFERALVERYGARVYAFEADPATAGGVAGDLPENLRLLNVRVGRQDDRREPGSAGDGARELRLPSLMRSLGHRRLDLIKLDGGGQLHAIRDLMRMDVDVRQLLLTFPPPGSGEGREAVEEAVAQLGAHGYRIFYIAPDGRAYSFIRTDFAGG